MQFRGVKILYINTRGKKRMSVANTYNADLVTNNPFIANMNTVATQYVEQQAKMAAQYQKTLASISQRLANYSQYSNVTTSSNYTSPYGKYCNFSTNNAVKISDSDANLNASFYQGNSVSGVNRRVDTKCNKSAAELNKHLTGVLAGKGEVFLEAERRYGVNAAFLIAICKLESGNGKSRLAKQQNNVGGMGGQGNFKTYASVDDCIFDIAKNISQGKYYFRQGKKTIAQIGPTYCDSRWASQVSGIMNQIA